MSEIDCDSCLMARYSRFASQRCSRSERIPCWPWSVAPQKSQVRVVSELRASVLWCELRQWSVTLRDKHMATPGVSFGSLCRQSDKAALLGQH